VELEYWQVERG